MQQRSRWNSGCRYLSGSFKSNSVFEAPENFPHRSLHVKQEALHSPAWSTLEQQAKQSATAAKVRNSRFPDPIAAGLKVPYPAPNMDEPAANKHESIWAAECSGQREIWMSWILAVLRSRPTLHPVQTGNRQSGLGLQDGLSNCFRGIFRRLWLPTNS